MRTAGKIKDEQKRNEQLAGLIAGKENRFAGVDYNGDGKVDFKELLALTVCQDELGAQDQAFNCKFSPYDIFNI